MINISKPTSSFSNSSKVSFGETWATITSTWASESRTWGATVSLINNTIAQNIDLLWGNKSYPWSMSLPWQSDLQFTNQAKP